MSYQTGDGKAVPTEPPMHPRRERKMRPVKVDIRGEDCDAVKYGTLADGEAVREGVDVTAVRRESR